MKQALHIFKKDVSYLRYDIGVTLLAAAAFTFAEIRHVPALGLLLPVTWWFLVARVIHAEALPGHRQFWLTRPYEWKSLLAAKVLFILVFVNLPLLTADAVIVQAVGFSIAHELTGLLWTQVLLLMAFVLPAAAFAAITSGLAELLRVTLLLVVAIVWQMIAGWRIHWSPPWWELEWVRTYCLVAELAAAALIILLWQYARRNTLATRTVAAATLVALLASSWLLPWSMAFALETHLSGQHSAALKNQAAALTLAAPISIGIDLDSERKWLGHIYAAEPDQMVAELPLRITGIPVDTELKPNGLAVTLRAADGETWTVNQPPPESFDFEAGITSLRASMGKAFYAKVKDQPVRFRGTLFFTLYGNKRSASIPIDGRSVPVNGIGMCSGRAHLLLCDSLFRPPSGLVTIRVWSDSPRGGLRATKESPFPRTSYSPFPADFNVDPLYESFMSPHQDTITAAEMRELDPVRHLEQDFDIQGVRLNEFRSESPLAR